MKMEVIEALLNLCSSAAAVFAIVLAYDSHKTVEQLEKRIGGFTKESDEIACDGDQAHSMETGGK